MEMAAGVNSTEHLERGGGRGGGGGGEEEEELVCSYCECLLGGVMIVYTCTCLGV